MLRGQAPTTTTTQTQKHKRGKNHGGKLTDAQLTKVATALGTTLETLKAAQAKVKAAVKATDERETRAQEDALLASELGVSVSELRAAFASIKPARGGRGERGGGCHGSQSDADGGTYPTDSAGTYPMAA
jgi:hypothetical protein